MGETAAADDRQRLEREAHFHDQVFVDDSRQSTGRFYTVAERSKQVYRDRVLRGCAGMDVLEYGCGPGSCAFDLARAGARVTGIDISPGAIGLARQRAEKEGLSHQLHFEVMNAEELTCPDASFDRICGSGILHHLDLTRAMEQINRSLRPTGDAVFFEPLGHNPLINWYRQRTPSMRTVDEHPLKAPDLEHVSRYFYRSTFQHYHLAALAASVWVGRPGFDLLLQVLHRMDRYLLSIPILRNQAWIAVAELEHPCPIDGQP